MKPRSLVAAANALCVAGCAGHADLSMIPLDTKRIDAKAPLVIRVEPDECYFWINDQQELCVAMRSARGSILGKRFQNEFLLSLVVKGVPAGGGREYRMDRLTARAKHHAGFAHTRAASLSGILAVWDYRQNHLRGRFRFTAKQQSYSVLTDWTGNYPLLFVGEFSAVHNEAAGKELLARTEEGSMSRSEPEPKRTVVPSPETAGDSK